MSGGGGKLPRKGIDWPLARGEPSGNSAAYLPAITVIETKRFSSWGVAQLRHEKECEEEKCKEDAKGTLKRPERSGVELSVTCFNHSSQSDGAGFVRD